MANNSEPKPSAEKTNNTIVEHDDQIEAPVKPSEIVEDAVAKGQVTSGYETLTNWQTVKKFKLVSLICFLAAFSAATDGYQVA